MEYLRARGAWVLKVHGNAFQHVGVPDLIVSLEGRFYAFEVKQPGKALTPAQDLVIRGINQSGGWALRVESIEDVQAALLAGGS